MVHPTSLRRFLALAEIGRIPNFATQREACIEFARYKRDGRGGLYITGRIRRKIVKRVRAGRLPKSAINDAMEVKVGHTRDLPRRRREYTKCRHPTYYTIWRAYYPARYRMKAERLVHLALREKGAHPVIYGCLGSKCHKRHREFVSLSAGGGWVGVEAEVISALKTTGQRGFKRIKLDNILISSSIEAGINWRPTPTLHTLREISDSIFAMSVQSSIARGRE
ncbi:hypothetical protein C8R44DRAFT_726367 [Mycena epipterygia]|nr:hypothetical protein C8R44DRAFT_726367 [Mycena epipterygia]